MGRNARQKKIQHFSLPVSHLKGVGAKRAALLAQKGIHTILDLLFFTPIHYQDRRQSIPIGSVREGFPALVQGRVIFGKEERFYRSQKRLYRIRLKDGNDILDLLWFRYKRPYLERFVSPENTLFAYGKVSENNGQRQMIHPDVTLLKASDPRGVPQGLGFYPVYSSVKGLSANLLRSAVEGALDNYLSALIDPVPGKITAALGLPDLLSAVNLVHRPPPEESCDDLNRFSTPFHKRLLFDRFFLVMVAVSFLKKSRDMEICPVMNLPSNLADNLERWFSFRLTDYQKKAVQEITGDMASGKPMSRLLLGDVGCGKTVVAAVAAYISAHNGKQTAFMVPTRILAEQHMEFFSGLPLEMGLRPALLTGKIETGELREVHNKIRTGACNLVIGTQALIQERIDFNNLDLVIIDEQHRFGVKERTSIRQKGTNPHRLVMTATPIPRTLAMTLYGDMEISVIEGYPEGHRPVATRLATEEHKKEVFETVKHAMASRRQCFVICPAIEGSEVIGLKNAVDMAEKLQKLFTPPYNIGLIHGRLDLKERENIMDRFRKGKIDLLVGTTVLEVGIHVPKATVMVIEDPERFGLAQLHQLRGRVGRGSEKGVCFLMVPGNLTKKGLTRLKIIAENHDGFDIAQRDLELRGQGELTGLRQTGVGELDFQEIIREQDLFFQAKEAAERLLCADPELTLSENEPLRTFVATLLTQSPKA